MDWRRFVLRSLMVGIGLAPWGQVRGNAPGAGSAPAPTALPWRSLQAPCLPAPGAVYVNKRSVLGRLPANTPIAIASEADFTKQLGCPSGVDWTRERLVLLLLQVGNMDAIRLEQAVQAGEQPSLRFRITCGAGYDDGKPRLAGSHVFFALLLPAASTPIDVKYRYFNVQTARYERVLSGCSMVPRAHPQH